MSTVIQSPVIQPKPLTTKEAASFMGVSKDVLRRWRTVGGGPRYYRLNKIYRYPALELESFLAARMAGGESDGQ